MIIDDNHSDTPEEKRTELKEVYTATQPLITQVSDQHEGMIDFVRGLRFLMSTSSPEATMFIEGLGCLLDHMHDLQVIAQSYHKAVGDTVKERQEAA